MDQHVLYLFIGYPGAGKTTIAKIIAHNTGACHIWADAERHKMFNEPNHSEEESRQLYNKLNNEADQLLAKGKSVVFDTNFNFLSDRDKLRQIAFKHSARTVIIWVTTPKEIARQRSVGDHSRNMYDHGMSEEQFDAITEKLEKPTGSEQVIKIDGSDLDTQILLEELGMDDS